MKRWVIGLLGCLGCCGNLMGEDGVYLTSPSDSLVKVGTASVPTLDVALSGYEPWGIAYTSAYNFYVFTDANVGLAGFNIGGASEVLVNDPDAVYHGVDCVGNQAYALRSGPDDLVRFDFPDVTPIVLATGFQRPNDVAIDSTRGQLWVTDSGLDQVRLYDLAGTQLGTWNLNGAWGVDVDEVSGTVYVSSYDGGILYRKTLGASSFVSKVTGLSGPRGVVVDRAGRVFVLEADADRVVQAVPSIGMFFPTVFAGALNGHGMIYEETTDRDGDYLADAWELGFGGSLADYDGVNGTDADLHSTLLEYAFFGDPTVNEGSLFASFEPNGEDGFSLSMTAREDADLLTNYFVSNDMQSWVEVDPTSSTPNTNTDYMDLTFDVDEADYFSEVTGKLFFKASAQPNR